MRQAFIFYLFLLSLVVSYPLSAQWVTGSGNVSKEDRTIGSFSAIDVEDGIDLYIRQGEKEAVTVKADDNIIQYIQTKVNGNTLEIKMTERIRRSRKREVYITLKDLEMLEASGGSDVYAEDGLELSELKLRASGGSDVSMELKVEKLAIQLSGGSDIRLSGSAKDMMIDASGGSDISAGQLEATNCKIETSGGSDAHINVTGKLHMEASGASDIHYSGSPDIEYQRSSGGSDITGN